MTSTPLFDLGVPPSGCGAVRCAFDGTELKVRYEFRRGGKDWLGTIAFARVIAFRFRDELRSAGYAPGAYDAVVQIGDSDWLQELSQLQPTGAQGLANAEHFGVLFSSNGYLECVAAECRRQGDVEGVLP